MNSWHTFSPNGRWLAFSSKARSPYTQLMLTHIDANGNDTPAIIVDNTTAANRAVNIPEFLNVPPDGLAKIDPEATKFFRYFNQAYELMENNQMPEAIKALRRPLCERDPDDPLAHFALATALSGNDQERHCVGGVPQGLRTQHDNASWFDHLAVSLDLNGHSDEAIDELAESAGDRSRRDGQRRPTWGWCCLKPDNTEEGYEALR